jgi:hypothetical protein
MIAFMVLAPHYQALWIRWVDLAKCVYGFGVGSLVYSSYLYLRENHSVGLDRGKRMVWTSMEVAAFSIMIAFVTAAAYLPIRVTAPLVFGAVVLVYAFDAGPISRLLAAPLPALLGVLSYSIYMVHPFLEYRVMKPRTGDRKGHGLASIHRRARAGWQNSTNVRALRMAGRPPVGADVGAPSHRIVGHFPFHRGSSAQKSAGRVRSKPTIAIPRQPTAICRSAPESCRESRSVIVRLAPGKRPVRLLRRPRC